MKVRYNEEVSSLRTEMESRYGESLTEVRRAAALLQIEVEKERQKVQGFKQALLSQRLQTMEERKQLKQVKKVYFLFTSNMTSTEVVLVVCTLGVLKSGI